MHRNQAQSKNAIVRFEGLPNEPAITNEITLWDKFKQIIWPFARKGGKWAKYGCELGKAFAEAELAKRENEAKKLAAEAANLAAEADFKRAKTLKLINDEIRRIFGNPKSSQEEIKLLLASLIKDHPEISEQIEKVGAIIERLAITKSLSLEIITLPFINLDDEE